MEGSQFASKSFSDPRFYVLYFLYKIPNTSTQTHMYIVYIYSDKFISDSCQIEKSWHDRSDSFPFGYEPNQMNQPNSKCNSVWSIIKRKTDDITSNLKEIGNIFL